LGGPNTAAASRLGREMVDWEKVRRLQSVCNPANATQRQEDAAISVESRPPEPDNQTPLYRDRKRHQWVNAGIKEALGGIIAVILISVAAVLWNSSSDGGLVHVFGGVASQELAKQVAIPGPQGSKGPAGPAGPRGDAGPPGTAPAVSLAAQTSADYNDTGPIPGSEAYPVCTLSKIVLRRNPRNPDRSCQLKRAQPGAEWEVVVNEAICGVTCFTFGGGK